MLTTVEKVLAETLNPDQRKLEGLLEETVELVLCDPPEDGWKWVSVPVTNGH